MLGWEPTEFHRFIFGGNGLHIGTVVQREVEWDDVEREKMEGLVQYESEICSCGLHKSVADEDPDLEMTERRCPVCAGLAQTMRQIGAQDEKATEALGKSPAPELRRPEDGRFFGLRPKVSPESARLLEDAKATRDGR